MKSDVIVTGGAGYIGSHICKWLSHHGYHPIVIDSLVCGHREFVKWGPLIEGKISDRSLLKAVFEKYQPQAVIHCAGLISVPESVSKPDLYYENNVMEGLILLQEMIRYRIDKIIFSSSCAVYGHANGSQISENDSLSPITPYGRSKLMFEQIIQDISRTYPLRHAILRYFNAAGADMDGEIGEFHLPETHLIPLILEVAAGRNEEFEIYGCDFPTTDGTAIRDFVHVSDLADGHYKALELLQKSSSSLVINLGVGKGLSVKEIVRLAERITEKKIRVHYSKQREGDPAVLVANNKKACQLLQWAPRRDIEDIIASAWKWCQKRH